MMSQGVFRDDLFYRIGVITLHIPPLRERTIDIPILADHFLKKFASEMNRNILGFDKKALKMMLLYPWSGNVRELQNAIERAVIFAEQQYLSSDDLKLETEPMTYLRKGKIDRERIINALNSAKGNISLASKLLGVARCTFHRYIKKYNINVS